MSVAANVIDFASYRQQRTGIASPLAAQQLPMCYIVWWSYVAVVMVAGYN